MDREATPSKQRHKTRNAVGNARGTMPGASPPGRAFRGGSQRPRTGNGPRSAAPATILTKPPVVILKGSNVHAEGGVGDVAVTPTHLAPSPGTRKPLPNSPPIVMTPRPVHRPSIAVPTAAASLIPPSTPFPLLTSHLQFASMTEVQAKLGNCLELTQFTVIGVLGFSGSGKSSLLSSIAAAVSDKFPPPVFQAATPEHLVSDHPQTLGVDMGLAWNGRVCTPRGGYVLLDAQPLHSAALLAEMLAAKHETPRFGPSPEQQVDAASFQLASWLLSVCHYVLIMQDSPVELELVRFLVQTLDRLQSCRVPSVSGGIKDRHHAKLVFVHRSLDNDGLEWASPLQHCFLEQVLPVSWLHRMPKKEVPSTPSKRKGNQGEQQTMRIPLWAVTPPHKYKQQQTQTPPIELQLWRSFLQRLPISPSFSNAPTYDHLLTLREWLANSARVWEGIRKSGVFTEAYASREYF